MKSVKPPWRSGDELSSTILVKELDLPSGEKEAGKFLVESFFGGDNTDIIDVRCPEGLSPSVGNKLLRIYSATIQNRMRAACPHRDAGLNDLCGVDGDTIFLPEQALLDIVGDLEEYPLEDWINFVHQLEMLKEDGLRLYIKNNPDRIAECRKTVASLENLAGRVDLEYLLYMLRDIAVYYDILMEREEEALREDPLGREKAMQLFRSLCCLAKVRSEVYVSKRAYDLPPLLTHARGGVIHMRDTSRVFARSSNDLLRCFPFNRTEKTMKQTLESVFELVE